jgi:hypothetical protein
MSPDLSYVPAIAWADRVRSPAAENQTSTPSCQAARPTKRRPQTPWFAGFVRALSLTGA